MAKPESEIISKAALAGVLGLSKARVSQLVAKGLPVLRDGKVDRAAAVKWYHDTAGLGNGLTRRGPKPKAPRALLVQPAAHDAAYWAVIETLQQTASPPSILRFARVGLRVGLTAQQAYIMALWHSCQPSLDIAAIDADDLDGFSEPTQEQWCDLLGENFDFHAGELAHDRATLPETSPQEQI